MENQKYLLILPPKELVFRIMVSFVPPYNKVYQRIYADLLGPFIAASLVTLLLRFGYAMKESEVYISPFQAVMSYLIIVPLLFLILSRFSQNNINYLEAFSLAGYALYGHIFTLVLSFICFQEESNIFFFICLIIFGGLSTLRLALIFLNSFHVPIVRLLVCSLISLLNILYLLVFHFVYMHSAYRYSKGRPIRLESPYDGIV